MTNQEKGLQRMRRVRGLVPLTMVLLVVAVLWLDVVFQHNRFLAYSTSPSLPLQAFLCMEVMKVIIALIQNHIAKKRGWPVPYGSFKEFF